MINVRGHTSKMSSTAPVIFASVMFPNFVIFIEC